MTSVLKKINLTNFLLYLFGFMLLWEWLRPVEELTNTSQTAVFILFLGLSLLLDFLAVYPILTMIIKAAYVFFALQFLHYSDSFRLEWLDVFWKDIKLNFSHLFQADWLGLTDMFRSLLFFILIWLMGYLLQYWLIHRKRIFTFFFMTILYITVLDTFTVYEGTAAIVRTIVIGFVSMAILYFQRLKNEEKIQGKQRHTSKWMLPFSLLLIISVLSAFELPKLDPIWPDPIPFIQSAAGNGGLQGGRTIQKVGYDSDDSRLGGPFVSSDEVVFMSEMEEEHYWKVETKEIYTGKGWETAADNSNRRIFADDVPINTFYSGSANTLFEEQTSTLYAVKKYPHVAYPHGIKEIQAEEETSFGVVEYLEKIYSYRGNQVEPLDEYTVVYDKAVYQIDDLTATSERNTFVIGRDFYNRYTQLPASLPLRVRELAEEITEGKDSWYDKAKAIESYFKQSDFTYDQTDVAIPEEVDDYTDQFLFETKRGYCDNFSTSMIVLLRSLDIPARWVKGFTGGELIESGSNMREITNNNAHSWVEVFFPNLGWVPFEPTKGFTPIADINYNDPEENGSDPLPNQETPTPEEPQTPEEQQLPESGQEQADSSAATSSTNNFAAVTQFVDQNRTGFIAGMIIIAILSFLLYWKRVKWLPFYYMKKYHSLDKEEQFAKAYQILLQQLRRSGLERDEHQTLREYARYVDHHFTSDEMSRLTRQYEEMLYRKRFHKSKDLLELWTVLMKKTTA
ncbi:DUF4129 domain-containing protein [Bacillaceae bacterium Marseille-Q3522]|nr:DUF4129 domain-containing protein [Bacillaceae bacterium Marseille-Q3522]